MIQFFFENISEIPINPTVKQWLEDLIYAEDKKPGDINYIFCDDQYLLKVNRDFLSHDYYTDIITFDYVKGKTISGDIFVSLPRISENAVSLGQGFDSELFRVIAHGVLHLCGYGDKSKVEVLEMRRKEDHYLSLFLK
ncbi:MAG: rRNA maturation RNase YbeY [Weeksellaceae bacterium]|nr:rRNA maturation RNase YbeY [Weeksellaceae bacterium]